jgi:hypothetical protein
VNVGSIDKEEKHKQQQQRLTTPGNVAEQLVTNSAYAVICPSRLVVQPLPPVLVIPAVPIPLALELA